MELNYKKNNNMELFNELCDTNLVDIENIQNYIPIYGNYFNLNENNYNSINLNNNYKLCSITEKLGYSKFNGTIIDDSNNIITKKIFFKYGPLVDPIKYMLGKYDNSYSILNLPRLNNNEEVNKKILDNNNSAYTDGFFSFLSSILLNKYDFINGIDYYGSFLGIKKNFIVDIEEDLEYLDDSDFFYKNNNILFNIKETENFKNYFSNTKKYKQALVFDDDNILDEEFQIDNLIDNKINLSEISDISNINDIINNDLEIEYTQDLNKDNINKKKIKTNEQNESESSCSSRYSNTESSKNEYSENEDNSSEDQSESSSVDEELYANIFKFPVQTIALECCEDTLDSHVSNNKIKDDEWESIIAQILFSLITYQKVFDFTHNDLHSNNIVYNTTDKKFLYYKYDNKHYKIPTFGKIYKIIDFGRAIYKFKGNIICSDSYAPDGDAHTQYNTEPYLNDEKPRLEPNYSFDLCRLGCSLFDYFIEDIEDIKKIKSPIKKLMITWVFDDTNKNILYKNNGSERYPDFKLYKMIARTVHNHKPHNVIKKSLFEKYLVPKKKINNQAAIFNIDNLPIFT
tara:strand:- start:4351 stop:6066 length:1716 start_codon:yes stop_codon:yes gene_type:complete